jgi:hypothetical protein
VVVRMRTHRPTIAYVKRRTAEGKTKREIIRCLKRFVAREIYGWTPPNTPRTWPLPDGKPLNPLAAELPSGRFLEVSGYLCPASRAANPTQITA